MEALNKIKYDNEKFEEYLEILIRKYEHIVSHVSIEVSTFLGFFVTLIITFLIAYIGWNIESLKNSLLAFWNGNIIFKLIMFSVMFTILYFTYKLSTGIMRIKAIENKFLKFLGRTYLRESDKKLNKLYLAKIDKKGWIMSVKVDDEKGILELVSVNKEKAAE